MAINLLLSLTSIVRQLPDKVTVQYAARSAGDTYAVAVNFDARRGPMNSGDIDGLERRWATWYLYALNGQTVAPARLGKITSGSDVWDVISVEKSFGNLHFICECILRL